jgi:branched-chain amino acid transport system permease protein
MVALQVGINGLLLGGFFALLASGLALVWGINNTLNFAHGALMVLGAYFAFWAFHLWSIDPLIMIPVNMVLLFAIGWVLYWTVLRWLRQRAHATFMMLLLTFGLSLLLESAMQVAWSSTYRSAPTGYAGAGLDVGQLRIAVVPLISALVSVVLVGLLWAFLSYTKLGTAIEATGLDGEGAELVGIDTSAISAFNFGVGSSLAGAAGATLVLGSSINPYIGQQYILLAALIVVLAGLGSVPGVLVGGVIVGLAQSYAAWQISAYSTAVGMGLLVLILLLRPRGLFGRKYFAEL